MKKQRCSSGPSFLKAFLILSIAFAMGWFHTEIYSAIQNTVQSISH